MNTGILRSPDKRVWRQFYKAVLFESLSWTQTKFQTELLKRKRHLLHVRENCFTQRETISKKSRLWMTRCMSCTPFGAR